MTDQSAPIVVGSVNRAQVESELRKFLLAATPLVSFIGATGWGQRIGLDEAFNEIVASVGVISFVLTWVWSYIATRRSSKKLVALADKVDNSVAVTK